MALRLGELFSHLDPFECRCCEGQGTWLVRCSYPTEWKAGVVLLLNISIVQQKYIALRGLGCDFICERSEFICLISACAWCLFAIHERQLTATIETQPPMRHLLFQNP